MTAFKCVVKIEEAKIKSYILHGCFYVCHNHQFVYPTIVICHKKLILLKSFNATKAFNHVRFNLVLNATHKIFL